MHSVIRKTCWLLSHRAAPQCLKLCWSPAYLFKALHCYSSFPPFPVRFPILLSSCPLSGRHVLESIHNTRSWVLSDWCRWQECWLPQLEMRELQLHLFFKILFAYWCLICTLKMCNWSSVSSCLTLKWHRRQVSKVSALQIPILKKSGVCICFGCSALENEKSRLAFLTLLLLIYEMWCPIYRSVSMIVAKELQVSKQLS